MKKDFKEMSKVINGYSEGRAETDEKVYTWIDYTGTTDYYREEKEMFDISNLARTKEILYGSNANINHEREIGRLHTLMKYYGGEITREEWSDASIPKFVIYRKNNEVVTGTATTEFHKLAFRTANLRDTFIEHNMNIVKSMLYLNDEPLWK